MHEPLNLPLFVSMSQRMGLISDLMVDLDSHKSTTNFEPVSIIIEVAPASFANCIPCLHATASATNTDATESCS
jgi:hypothetical protein